jgi:uncharacterized Zn finger protein (UPF0148 family)
MSDFDEEAERERLREKYEQDQQDRQATEKMSELLLQGATMTNAHCSDCGDPVFRYEGQEFCATCEKAIDRGDGAAEADGDSEDGAAEADGDSEDGDAGVDGAAGERDDGADETNGEAGAPDDEHIHVTSPDETRVQFGSGDADTADPDAGTARPESPARPDRTPGEPEADASQGPRGRPTRPGADDGRPQPGPESDPNAGPERVPGVDPSPAPGVSGDSPDRDAGTAGSRGDRVPQARASLERTLARLSRQAEAAEDPTQAREYLAAAREAAETLAALRQ